MKAMSETCPRCNARWWLYAPYSEKRVAFVCGSQVKDGKFIKGTDCKKGKA